MSKPFFLQTVCQALLLLSLAGPLIANPVAIGDSYNTKLRPTGRIRQDINSLQRELNATVRALQGIYLENPEQLKEVKVSEARRLWNRFIPLVTSLWERTEELSLQEGNSHFVQVAQANRSRSQSIIEDLCRRIARMSPLDLLAREKALRPGKLWRERKFYSADKSEPTSGEALFQEMMRGYRAFFLRTKTTYLQAREIFSRLSENHPDYLPAFLWLARTDFELGEVVKALDTMQRLFVQDPDLRVARALDLEMLDADQLFLYKVPTQPLDPLPQTLPVAAAVKTSPFTPAPLALVFTGEATRVKGLSLATIVMEHPLSSGGWVGLYKDFQDAEKRLHIGPLAALRGFTLQYLVSSRAMIAHAGVSAAAEGIRWQLDYRTLDQNDGSMEFVREEQYPRQHYYFLPARMDETFYRLHRKTADPLVMFSVSETGYPYQDETVTTVAFSNANGETVSYTRSPESGGFHRYHNGELTRDALGQPLFEAENLLVQFLPEASMDQPAIGQGAFTAYLRGKRVIGRWTKPSEFLPTVYMLDNGSPLLLAPGKLWHILWNGAEPQEIQ